MPNKINIDDLNEHVVVYNKAMNAHHFCSKHQYTFAASQPGYDWELKESFETEIECQEFIDAQSKSEPAEGELSSMTVADLKALAAEKSLPEAEWKSLKKAELVEYLTDK